MDFCKCGSEGKTSSTYVPAISTTPPQPWETPYEPDKGLKQGTIFPSLDKPFYVTGGGNHG